MIKEFYEDTEIFVTGGSGVVGKAVIEKLLRSCNVRRIYLLLRPKKGLDIEERIKKLFKARLYDRLHAEKPDEVKKVTVIPGDVALPNLGITAEYVKLMENVSIVFHCAATVRFDEPLRDALRLNVAGTLEALNFAETLKNLKIFMHVSTFFSNPYLEFIEPKVYKSPVDWRVGLKLLEMDINDDMLDTLTRKLIIGFPNTYTFTKNLAESLVNDYRHRVPVGIFRPSIVLFSLNEPIPVFPPSLTGAMGIFAAVGAGILKTVYLGDDIYLDITPQDVCVKALILTAVNAASFYVQKEPIDMVPIYIASSANYRVLTFKEMAQNQNCQWKKSPFEKSFLVPNCHYTSCRFVYMFLVYTKQVIPSFLVDRLLILFGRKPILMSLVRRIFYTLEVMKPFMFNNYDTDVIPMYNVVENTKCTEFDIFEHVDRYTTLEGIKEASNIMALNVREILLREDPKTIPRAKKILRIKIWTNYAFNTFLVYYLSRWIYRKYLIDY